LRIGIVGSYLWQAPVLEWQPQEMVYFTVRDFLRQHGLSRDSFDIVIGAASDMFDGRGISNAIVADALGANLKPESKVDEDGLAAAFYACLRLMAGEAQSALVVAYAKTSEPDIYWLENSVFDPFYLRPLGLDFATLAGLSAQAYLEAHGAAPECLARLVGKNYAAAAANPRVGAVTPVDEAAACAAAPVVGPLKQYDLARYGDGVCVMLLATEERAVRLNPRSAWILGFGAAQDAYYPGLRDLARSEAARRAARQAYAMAKIDDPRRIQVAEVTGAAAHEELLLAEALGLCPEGRAWEYVEKGYFGTDGHPALNPSGGCLPLYVPLVAGLSRLAEAALQVTGQAGPVQVPGVRLAVAHGSYGPCLQTNFVFVVGGE